MDKKLPLVTVVIPCYNHAQYVQESIQSVIDQDYDNIELIIIDDGSKDNSVEKIQEMVSACEERFKRFEFRFRPNKGLCATLNEALDWSCGEYFSPIASDDIILPHKISFLVDKIKQTNAAAVFGGVNCIGQKSQFYGVVSEKRLNFKSLMMHEFLPPAPSSLMNKNAIGRYDENVKLEDWFMWLKLTEQGGDVVVYPEVVACYRWHESNTVNRRLFIHEERVKVLEFFKHSSLYSQALSNIYLLNANENIPNQKLYSIKQLLLAKSFTFRSLKVFLRIVLPDSLKAFVRHFA